MATPTLHASHIFSVVELEAGYVTARRPCNQLTVHTRSSRLQCYLFPYETDVHFAPTHCNFQQDVLAELPSSCHNVCLM